MEVRPTIEATLDYQIEIIGRKVIAKQVAGVAGGIELA